MWLGTLLTEQSEDIYRMKGLLSVDGMDERFVFQVITPIESASGLYFNSLPTNCLSSTNTFNIKPNYLVS